jgi:hypothetical protein
MGYHAGADVYDEKHSWQFRVLLASFPQDPEGAIVRAVLGRNMKRGLRYGLTAVIDRDGIVRASVQGHDGETYARMPIGSIISLRDSFRRLADHCRLPDHEREALFEELRKWIITDERAQSGLDIRAHN